MVKKHFVDDGVEPVDAEYSLTQRGRAAATEVALAAKRCLPGWPPPGRPA